MEEVSKVIAVCMKDTSVLVNLECSGAYEDTIREIREGIDKRWSAKKIVKSLSGKGRNWLVREYQRQE